MTTNDIERTFRRASKLALTEWRTGDAVSEEDINDLVNDLWVWYMESPAVQQQISEAEPNLAVRLVYFGARQILSRQALESDVFRGKTLYSSESVMDALKGRSTNRQLTDVLSEALKSLEAQNEGYREAIRRRYDDGLVPAQNSSEHHRLVEARKSLTNHVNVIHISRGDVGSATVPAESRRASGSTGDPVADLAIALADKGDEPMEDRDGGLGFTRRYVVEEPTEDRSLRFVQGTGSVEPQCIFEDQYNTLERVSMYRREVHPNVIRGEKPMQVTSWGSGVSQSSGDRYIKSSPEMGQQDRESNNAMSLIPLAFSDVEEEQKAWEADGGVPSRVVLTKADWSQTTAGFNNTTVGFSKCKRHGIEDRCWFQHVPF